MYIYKEEDKIKKESGVIQCSLKRVAVFIKLIV